MRSGDEKGQPAPAVETTQAGYEPPKLEVLGTLTELTQLGSAPPDELLNDGSQV